MADTQSRDRPSSSPDPLQSTDLRYSASSLAAVTDLELPRVHHPPAPSVSFPESPSCSTSALDNPDVESTAADLLDESLYGDGASFSDHDHDPDPSPEDELLSSPLASPPARTLKRQRVPTPPSAVATILAPPSTANATPSDSIKDKVRQRDLFACWSCGDQADSHNVCHVTAKKAGALFMRLHNAGILPFGSLAHISNLIALCPNCHTEFDRAPQPGWVFYPADLDFFVDWEERDYTRRRERWQSTGERLRRRVPLPRDYRGSYRRYQLLVGSLNLKVMAAEPEKRWEGSPTAAIIKASPAMAQVLPPPPLGPPDEERQLFLRLMLLYGRPEPWPVEPSVPLIRAVPIVSPTETSVDDEPPLRSNASSPAPTTQTDLAQSPPASQAPSRRAQGDRVPRCRDSAPHSHGFTSDLASRIHKQLQERLPVHRRFHMQVHRATHHLPHAWGPNSSSAHASRYLAKVRQRQVGNGV